jgi:hypothetical protein
MRLRRCARRNGHELLVRELVDRQIPRIDHLRGLAVQPVRDFANSGKFAFLGLLDQLGRNPAERKRIAPELDQQRAVKRLFPVQTADGSSHYVLGYCSS